MTPWNDKISSPGIFIPGASDPITLDEASLNSALYIMNGAIGQLIFCPFDRANLEFELLPSDWNGSRIANRGFNPAGFTQSVAGKRPVLSRDANGVPYLNFDGVDDFLYSETAFQTGTTTFYCAFRWKENVASDFDGIYTVSSQPILLMSGGTANFHGNTSSGYRVNGVSATGLVPSGKNILSCTMPTQTSVFNLFSEPGTGTRQFKADFYGAWHFRGSHDAATRAQIEAWIDNMTQFGMIP